MVPTENFEPVAILTTSGTPVADSNRNPIAESSGELDDPADICIQACHCGTSLVDQLRLLRALSVIVSLDAKRFPPWTSSHFLGS